MGIRIDFYYNLSKVKLTCSFDKSYFYDANYTLRAKASHLKIISIDQVAPAQVPAMVPPGTVYYSDPNFG